MKYMYGIILHLIFLICIVHTEQKAVINVPIADLIGQQMITIFPDISADQAYKNISVCGGDISFLTACPRLHQLLYNEIVTVNKIVADEACISISHAYCLNCPSSLPHTTYWVLKKNLTFLDDLIKKKIDISHIPAAIDFSDKHHTILTNNQIITLKEPQYDSMVKIHFSAGTRFIKTPRELKRKASTIEVYAINYDTLKEYIIKIPIKKCIFNKNIETNKERIADFVDLLKKWCQQKKGWIPYVWGGTSFTRLSHTEFKEVTQTGPRGDYSFYEYEKDTQSPKSGFDCSGIILRAAQICSIPYFSKNTTTIAQCLSPLKVDEQLQEGDLILIKGHVMVISDMKKNLLIEARGYNHGYGKIHEIPLNQVFDGIETYNDLLNAFHEKKIIKRKDKNGKIRDSFSNLRLFSMESCFK